MFQMNAPGFIYKTNVSFVGIKASHRFLSHKRLVLYDTQSNASVFRRSFRLMYSERSFK